MEWVEVTGKTLEAAEERALDQLGVGRDEAEFDILEEPRSGLFGLMRGEARVRARVKPAEVRPKNDRRRRSKDRSSRDKSAKSGRDSAGRDSSGSVGSGGGGAARDRETDGTTGPETTSPDRSSSGEKSSRGGRGQRSTKSDRPGQSEKQTAASSNGTASDAKAAMTNDDNFEDSPVSPTEVAQAAEVFLNGLSEAFGLDADVSTAVDGEEIDATVSGDELGLMVGPSGRTLNAIQDLTRVSAQRRLGDHVTRLRIDIAGYREKRREALEAFTAKVAASVMESGQAKALEPMSSADRKVVHDTVNSIDGVESRSDGDDPARRVVIVPAE